MKALGIGMRVWVGWTPDACVKDDSSKSTRLSCGVIIDGPYKPGASMPGTWRLNGLNESKWDIEVRGRNYYVAEHLLTPIDDYPDSVTEPTEQEVEA